MQGSDADTMADRTFVLAPSPIVVAGCWYRLRRYGTKAIVDEMVRDSPSFAEKSGRRRYAVARDAAVP